MAQTKYTIMIGAPNKRQVSAIIISAFLLAFLGLMAGFLYLVSTGVIPINLSIDGTITMTGAIPINLVVVGILGGLGTILWVALSGVYGEDTVDAATDDISDTVEGDDGE